MNRIIKLFAAGIVIIVLGAACSSTGPAPEKASSAQDAMQANRIAVGLKEFKVSPGEQAVSAGPVAFSVTNGGQVEHEFVILRTSDAPGALPLTGAEATEVGHVDEIEGIQPGSTGSLTVDLTPGHYVLICNLPGHYEAGMYAGLTVA